MQGVSIRAMKGTIVLVIEVHQATMLTLVKLTLVCIIAVPQYWAGRALHRGRWKYPTVPEDFVIGPILHLSIVVIILDSQINTQILIENPIR